ncbi:hypothetical protein ACFPPD_25170 [Cohnella suwonensis]|uniref:Uncharacterized protein n=1 Tax=Cohnella suwonensis TaxID=696072 RepID=A0ABW0M1J9_9BACL
MTQQEILRKKMASGYKKTVVEDILKRRNAGLPDALKVFHRYYIKLDKMVMRLKTIGPGVARGPKSPVEIIKATQKVGVKRQRAPIVRKAGSRLAPAEMAVRDMRSR